MGFCFHVLILNVSINVIRKVLTSNTHFVSIMYLLRAFNCCRSHCCRLFLSFLLPPCHSFIVSRLVCLSSHCPLIVPVPRPSEPVLWAGPELLVLSLLSCHSPVLPRCWLHTLAANRKSECHRDVSQGWLCLRSGCQLHGYLPHVAVLLFSGVSLQQVWPYPATRGQPGPLALHRQHSEGSQVSLHGPFS